MGCISDLKTKFWLPFLLVTAGLALSDFWSDVALISTIRSSGSHQVGVFSATSQTTNADNSVTYSLSNQVLSSGTPPSQTSFSFSPNAKFDMFSTDSSGVPIGLKPSPVQQNFYYFSTSVLKSSDYNFAYDGGVQYIAPQITFTAGSIGGVLAKSDQTYYDCTTDAGTLQCDTSAMSFPIPSGYTNMCFQACTDSLAKPANKTNANVLMAIVIIKEVFGLFVLLGLLKVGWVDQDAEDYVNTSGVGVLPFTFKLSKDSSYREKYIQGTLTPLPVFVSLPWNALNFAQNICSLFLAFEIVVAAANPTNGNSFSAGNVPVTLWVSLVTSLLHVAQNLFGAIVGLVKRCCAATKVKSVV